VITVRHINRASRQPIGCGIGSCSTKESKYRYRNANRKCPKCGAEAIIAGREEYGGGWLCFKKKGGCGEKFPIEWPAIASQIAGRVENPDIADMRNTVLKMALKRSLVSASLGLGCVSDLFTQDLEEQGTYDLGNGAPTSPVPAKPESPPTKAPRKPKEKPAAARASTPPAEAPDPTEPTEWGPWAAKRCETFNARWTFEVREKGYPAIEELTNPMNVWRMNYALATRAVREQKIPEMPTGFKRQDWAGRELATLWKQDQPWVRAAAKAYLIERQGEFRAKAQAGAAEAAKAKPAREPGEDEDDDADILY